MKRKTPLRPLRLAVNTVTPRRPCADPAIVQAFDVGDLAELARLAPHTDAYVGCYEHDTDLRFTGLTLMAKAVVMDAERGGCLYVPILHRLGVPLDAVDREGATLLHLAHSLPVFRYLVEHGTPVPEGQRDRLMQIMAKDGLELPAESDEPVAYLSREGSAPHEVRWRLSPTRKLPDFLDPVSIPANKLATTLSEDLLESLREVGLGDPEAMAEAGFLFSVAHEMKACMMDEDAEDDAVGRLKRLDALGLLDGRLPLSMPLACDRDYDGELGYMSPQGMATLLDAENGEVHWLKAFRKATLHGVHMEGGRSLLHLADDPAVCRWLLKCGVSPHVADDANNLPAQVLPREVALVVEQAILSAGIPRAKVNTVRTAARL